MRLLVDAQLPPRLVEALRGAGHDVVHTSDLPQGNRTTDAELVRIADADDRIVMSKDRDFRDSHLLGKGPAQLLSVSTGNIRNTELVALVVGSLPKLEAAFEGSSYVELTRHAIVSH